MSKSMLIATSILSTSAMMNVDAKTTTSRDVRFAKELTTRSLPDYAEKFLKGKIRLSPPDVELLRIQLAETYFMMNTPEKDKEANSIISGISEDSKYYPIAQLTVGKINFLKKKYKEAIVPLKKFNDYCKQNYSLPDFDKELEKEGLGLLINTYRSANDNASAQKVIEEFQKRYGGDQEKSEQVELLDKARLLVFDAESITNPEEKKKTLNEALKILVDKVPYLGLNEATIEAFYTAAKAYYLMGEYDKAIKAASQEDDFVSEINDIYLKKKAGRVAPGAAITYWKGKSYLAKSENIEDKEEKLKLYKMALVEFLKNLKIFEGNQYASKVYPDYLKVLDELESMGAAPKKLPTIAPPVKIKRDTILSPQLITAYNTKQYDKFIQIVSKMAVTQRLESGVEDAIAKLAMAYLETGQIYKSLAYTHYLANVAPNLSAVPNTILMIANKLWSSDREEDKMLAISEYKKFLEVAPGNSASPKIAMFVAGYYYKKAIDLANKGNKTKDIDERNKIIDQAKEAFIKAVPYYTYISENFGLSEMGKSALQYAAACYSMASEHAQAAKLYEKYMEQVKDKLKPADLADIIIKISNSYFSEGIKFQKIYKQINTVLKDARIKEADKKEKIAKLEADYNKNKEAANKNFKIAQKYLYDFSNNNTYTSMGAANVKKNIETAVELLAWTYELLDEKEKAAHQFGLYIKKYPNSKKVPKFMQKQGELYAKLEDYDTAAKILESLAKKFPKTEEGKKALFTLGKSMFSIEKYSDSINTFNKMLDKIDRGQISVPVSSLKWIVKNMQDVTGTEKSEAGKLMVRTGKLLEKKICSKNPNLDEWIGKEAAFKIAKNPTKKKETIDLIKERLFMNIGEAAANAGLTSTAVEYISKVLSNPNTAYIFEATFIRVEQYIKLKNYDLALNDLNKIANIAMSLQKQMLSIKINNKWGDICLLMNDLKKAFSKFNLSAARPVKLDENMMSMLPKDKVQEFKDSIPLVEYAIYKAAFCAAKLGLSDKDELQKKYVANFPKGKFISEIKNLPESIKQNINK